MDNRTPTPEEIAKGKNRLEKANASQSVTSQSNPGLGLLQSSQSYSHM
jgi:hypothetical protein